MPLYVDGREEEKHGWVNKLLKLGMDAKVGKNLPADFLFQCPLGLVLVERKTWTDFVASITGAGGADGGNRLVGQLIGGPRGAAIRVLFMEGPMPQYVSGKQMMTAEGMDDASLSLQWQFGVLFAHSLSHDHTPSRMAALYRYFQKEDHGALLRPVPPVPIEQVYMNPEFRRKIAAMMVVPQLGEKGALVLPQHTKSPAEAINLSQDELLKLPGFGKLRAKNFYDFWHSNW